ncbi:energy-coupled thiamine transporter ThiT [Peribacillus asahii]|nr:energy-coupled thiamine transporter ThiT [Peribacillus asahii]USK87234.1 energy-coupled thiamine transporter ThiT [Peribacillus asahii]
MMNNKTLFLVEVAIFAALALLLDFVSGAIMGRFWPQGGSISLAMVPVFLMAFRWGVKGGVLTGVLLGGLQIITGAIPYHFASWIIDYFLAFGVVGFAGVYVNKVNVSLREGNYSKANFYIISGVLLGSFLRFLCHFASGIILYGEYAPPGQPVALYSLVYNGTYMLGCFVLSAIIVAMLYSTARNVLIRKAY